MLSRVKDYIKTHDAIRRPVEIVQLAVFFVLGCYGKVKAIYPRHLSKKYRNPALLKYKNIHEGKRCFIVATGPSLTLEDVNTLVANNEYCFTVNSGVRILDKTDWRPTYYCVGDPLAAQRLEADYKKHKLDTVFYNTCAVWFTKVRNKGPMFAAGNAVPYYEVYSRNTFMECNYLWSLYYQRTKKPNSLFQFLRNPTGMYFGKQFCPCSNIVQTAIYLARYMGFKEIYLLGTDCNYATCGSNPQSKIAEYSSYSGETHTQARDDSLIEGYRRVKSFLDEHGGCKVYNASRGGRLEVFERVNFDSLFNKDSSGAEAT